MTPARLRWCLDQVGWSTRHLAGVLGCDERLVRRWLSGQFTIPPKVGAWLEALAAVHAANPVPDWRQRAA